MNARLPDGFTAGHWTDAVGLTGCTVILAPPGATAGGEVRGGGPATRESELLVPAAAVEGVQAILLTGGSAFGLAAADGVSLWLEERATGFATAAGVVPLVAAAAVFDLALGSARARPDAASGYAACGAARATLERGSVGAGTGCTVGKALGPGCWTKGGLGYAASGVDGGATIAAIAVVNPFGEVLDEHGHVLAGVHRGGAYVRTVDLLRAGTRPSAAWREATTLACVLTDAALTKLDAWRCARAASAGVARSIDPAATVVDGDAAFCVAAGVVPADPFAVAAIAAEVVAAAVRDAVRMATGAPACPSAAERAGRR